MKKQFNISLILLVSILLSFSLSAQKTNVSTNNTSFKLKKEKPSFSINFPAEYKMEESSDNEGLKTELYRALLGNEVYMLKYTEHSNPVVSSDNETYMNASLQSFETGIKGTIQNSKKIKYNKIKGAEAFLSLDDKNMYVFYRVFIINKVQFQLIVISNEKEKTKNIKTFFESFKF